MISFRRSDTSFIIDCPEYRCQLDSHGRLLLLRMPAADLLLDGLGQDLWQARQENGILLRSTTCPPPVASWDQPTSTLRLDFESNPSRHVREQNEDHPACSGTLSVSVFLSFAASNIDLWAEIDRTDGDTIKYFYLPHGLEFPIAPLNRFLFPRTYGVSLTPAFFTAKKRMEGGYPGPMDFMHIDSEAVQLSLYGIQPVRERPPFTAGEPLLVPGRLHVSGVRRQDDNKGLLRHGWNVWIPAGEHFTTPRYRLALVDDWIHGVQDYGRINEISRTLEEKVGPLYEKLRRSYVVKYEKDSFSALAQTAEALPAPAIIHFAGWLPNGFDRYYPKHLPPHPKIGTVDDFAALCRRAAESGHLVMPYTNYTWWCYDTPYLEEHGFAALQLRTDECPLMEHYYEQIGYAASMWSPIHQQIMFEEVDALKDIGVHLLSVDQMSARPFRPPFMTEEYWWDHNPASPTPYAAVQGMADAAKELAAKLPLSTEVWENGPVDYLVNWCFQFCGHGVEGFDQDDVRFAPLIHALAHDKTIFTWHDLAQDTSVWNDYRLALSLLLGFQLIYVEGSRGEPARAHRKLFVTDDQPDDAYWPNAETAEWIDWLHRLSITICAQYIGQPLTDFSYITDHVLSATYGPVTIVVNLGLTPYSLADDIVLSAHGFYATCDDVRAGLLDRFENHQNARMRLLKTD